MSTNENANVTLSGFRDIDSSSMAMVNVSLKKHLRRMNELTRKMESLHITLKSIHERQKSEKYEIHAKLVDDGKAYASKVTEYNLLIAIDKVLSKITNEID